MPPRFLYSKRPSFLFPPPNLRITFSFAVGVFDSRLRHLPGALMPLEFATYQVAFQACFMALCETASSSVLPPLSLP